MSAPGPMRLVTEAEISANAAALWRKQYDHWRDGDRFADGSTKGETNDQLNRAQHTPENITRILNEGWARPCCDSCGQHVHAVVQFADTWGDASAQYCGDCLAHAASLARSEPHTPNTTEAR